LAIDYFVSRLFRQLKFLTIDVIEVDVFVVDVKELDVLGARRFCNSKQQNITTIPHTSFS
jgi:hypothetical protein